MKMEQKTKSKGLIARILGEQPTTDQKTIVRFMFLMLLLWPIGLFMSIFFCVHHLALPDLSDPINMVVV